MNIQRSMLEIMKIIVCTIRILRILFMRVVNVVLLRVFTMWSLLKICLKYCSTAILFHSLCLQPLSFNFQQQSKHNQTRIHTHESNALHYIRCVCVCVRLFNKQLFVSVCICARRSFFWLCSAVSWLCVCVSNDVLTWLVFCLHSIPTTNHVYTFNCFFSVC